MTAPLWLYICPAQVAQLNLSCSICPAQFVLLYFVLLQLSKSHLLLGHSSYQLVARIGNATLNNILSHNISWLTNSSMSTNSPRHSTSMLLTITKPPGPSLLLTLYQVAVTIDPGISMLLCVCNPAYSALTATAALCRLLALIRPFTNTKWAPVLQNL